MTRDQIKKRVIASAVYLVGWYDAGEAGEATKLVDDFDMDSLDLVEYAMEIEDEFGICITDDEIERWHKNGSVGSVTDLVYEKLNGVRPASQGILRRWIAGVR